MTPENFVKAFYEEKQNLLKVYLTQKPETEVGELIKSLNLDENQFEILKRILDTSFTDIFYTILLGLDGSASIGGIQEMYDLKDENGNQLSGSGDIEGYTYEYFHEKARGNR